jgi:anti-sigma B factor antagonist
MSDGSSDAPPERFRTDLEPHRETIVLAAHGEIDIDTAGQLDEQLRELLERGFERVVLDLRGVTFIDSSGLHAILDASAASDRAGVEFAIVKGPAPVERVFELTQTDSALRFIDGGEIDGSRR